METNHKHSEEAVRGLVTQLQTAWEHGDAALWAEAFTENARFTTLRGDVFTDRQQIENSHRMIFAGVYKGSHNAMSVESLVFLTPDVAIVHVMNEVTGFPALPPGIPAWEPGVLRARMQLVAVRHGERWEFVAAENVAVFPKPAGGPPAR